MINVNNKWFSWIKYWIVSHLGINPRKGGNPPKDKKFIINNSLIMILLFNEIINCLI